MKNLKEPSEGELFFSEYLKFKKISFVREVNQCKLGFINILNENGLRESKSIADDIFGKFMLFLVDNY